MAAGTASLCFTLIFVGVFMFVSAEKHPVMADPGQSVTLTCQTQDNKNKKIIAVKWIRADLQPEYVLVYRDGHFVPANQHPSFKNRVDLQDRQMKDGDVSVILKDVTTNDTGTYECHVFMEGARTWNHTIIYLSVAPPEKKYITVESGEDVTLTCRAPNNNIRPVKWIRADLESEYVLLHQDGQFYPAKEHPSFKNRVDLQDRQMKDGDVSVILKDVTTADEGTYKCRVFMEETQSWKPISIINLIVPPPEEKAITADPGQDVTLTCRAPNTNKIRDVKWITDDLEPKYLFLYQDGQFVPDEQHPSFKNRVDLLDRQMKDGDVSVILKDVTVNDTGAYECRVLMDGTTRRKKTADPISIITLTVVDPPGQP